MPRPSHPAPGESKDLGDPQPVREVTTPVAARRLPGRLADNRSRETPMQIPKDQILELLRSRGQDDQAAQAEGELPDQVDTEQHAGLLEKFGIDPGDLAGGLGGGVADKLGL